MFPPLHFPAVNLTLRKAGSKVEVFDIIRKKYVTLTPEEWVRQHVVHFLISHKNYPSGLLEVEKSIRLFNTQKRVDILIRDRQLKPYFLIECKAAEVQLRQEEINQLARYQLSIHAPYLMLTNGLRHIIIGLKEQKTELLQEIPPYSPVI